MTNHEKEQIEEAVSIISWDATRVLAADRCEEYELRRLKEALVLLLDKANEK